MTSTAPALDKRIPVYLLTGYLGSGKTSLLKSWLGQPEFKEAALIINELGDTGLDQIFAQSNLALSVESEHIADNTVLLSSGCLCCTLKNELADTLRDLFFKRALAAIPQFNRLIWLTKSTAKLFPPIFGTKDCSSFIASPRSAITLLIPR